MKNSFKRLVRFKDSNGRTLFGEAPSSDDLVGREVPVYEGDNPWDLRIAGTTAKICSVRQRVEMRMLTYLMVILGIMPPTARSYYLRYRS